MRPRAMTDIAVIGGGYSGLAAAVRLGEIGLHCTVFEAGPVLGGRARRVAYRERILDNGQHILSGAYTALLGQMQLVGVPREALRRIPLTLEVPPRFSLRAARLPAPLHLASALLFARGLDWRSRIAAVRLMNALKHDRFQVDPDYTVDQLLQAHHQPAQLVEWLWRPLTVSALNTPTAIASAQVFANVLRDALASARAASDLLLPMTDLSALFPEPAAIWLAARGSEVRTGARVTAVSAVSDGFEVVCDGSMQHFSRLIVAVGAQQLPALGLSGLATTAFAYEPIVTVYLQYPQNVRLPYEMTGCTLGLAQWFFDRGALSMKDAPASRGLIAAVISASGAHENLDQTQLAARLHDELAALVAGLPPLLWHKAITEKFATFSCRPGLVRPATITPLRHCYLAGDFVANDYPATLEGAVRNGIRAADFAASSL